MRAPGMTLMRMPVFVWMMLVVAFLTLFAMPPVTAALIQVFIDRNFDANFFNAAAGGDPLLYQHLFWIFGHPEVYILILPGMGIVSEILPVFSRKPLFGYAVVVFSGIAIGFLGWGVWAHHMFTTGIGPVATSAFGLATMLIAVPTGVKIFNWLGTVWGGSVRLATPMLFALGFIAQFTIGGLSGVMHAIVPADTQQTRHLLRRRALPLRAVRRSRVRDLRRHLLLVPEGLRPACSTRRSGKTDFWLMVIGFNLTFFPMHFLGLEGQPRRTYTYPEGLGWDTLNLMATIGAFIIALVGARRSSSTWSSTQARGDDRRRRPVGRAHARVDRPRRRRPSTTSPRSRSSRTATSSGTASTPRTTKAGCVRLPGRRPRSTPRTPRSRRSRTTSTCRRRRTGRSCSRWACRSSATASCSRTGASLAVGVAILFFGLTAWAIEPATEAREPRRTRWRTADRGRALMAAGRRHRADEPDGTSRTSRADATHETNTGVSNTKLGIWMFLASEACSSVRSSRRTSSTAAATPSSSAARHPTTCSNIPFTSVTSFVLLMSSLTMVLALAAIQRGDHRRLRIWLLATALFGLTFIGGQVFEFTEFYREGLSLSVEPVRHDVLHAHRAARRPRHDRHHLAADALRPLDAGPAASRSSSEAVEIAGLYWHFVDIVWIIIFTAIYLIPGTDRAPRNLAA